MREIIISLVCAIIAVCAYLYWSFNTTPDPVLRTDKFQERINGR